MTTTTAHPPLTAFSDDEQLFREAVAAFAADEVKPRVQAMERASKIDPDLFPKYFELGLMGIEVPEQFGGAPCASWGDCGGFYPLHLGEPVVGG